MIQRFAFLALIASLVQEAHGSTLFENSVVSNDIDFIKETDSTVKSAIKYLGISQREMPDKRTDILFDKKTYLFLVEFQDQFSLEVWAHSDFSQHKEAEAYVGTIAGPLGRLPHKMRKSLSHIVLHKGNESAFAEHLGGFFVLYSENIIKRLKTHDLEETLFHESVHATLDSKYRDSSGWLRAQELDNIFVTEYAKNNPATEDLAESSLFVYTLIEHPGRLPNYVSEWLSVKIPNRIEFIGSLFSE